MRRGEHQGIHHPAHATDEAGGQWIAFHRAARLTRSSSSPLSLHIGNSPTKKRSASQLIIWTFALLGPRAECSIIQSFQNVRKVQTNSAGCRCNIAIIADRAEMELLEHRNRCRVELFHVTDRHVAANQPIKSKHQRCPNASIFYGFPREPSVPREEL